MMKITVLMGSPNRNGSTSILVQNFQKGAEEAGHSAEVIDVCHADIRRKPISWEEVCKYRWEELSG
jgi:multimeric flavodoxin WrbA